LRVSTIMKQQVLIHLFLLLTYSAAFLINRINVERVSFSSPFLRQSSSLFMSDEKPLTKTKNGELWIDDNFDGVDLARVLGGRRVKKINKKKKRIQNQLEKESVEAEKKSPKNNKPSHRMKKQRGSSKRKGPFNIIIAGAPASGKGTQCTFIEKKYGVVHLSTGDMLRAAVAAGTDTGKVAKEYMDAGKLVSDDIIINVVKERLQQSDCQKKGWLLDGFPRTRVQAESLAESGIEADCFLFLNVSDEVLVERVIGRRSDPETGKIYHMKFSPPENEVISQRLVQRSDDTEEKVKVRLEQFHTNIDAVKGSYEDILCEIDGTSVPDIVANSIATALQKSK